MGELRFSRLAEADLEKIALYTLDTWGEEQVIRYLDRLEESCSILAGNPSAGRPCDDIRPGLRRMECGRHVIFYRQEPGGIFVSRILHQSMLPGQRAMPEEDEAL